MALEIEGINIRKVGGGFIVRVEMHDPEEQIWDSEEEVFVDRDAALEFVNGKLNES